MPNTYSQIYLHLVFAVEYRDCVISPGWRDKLYAYIGAAFNKRGHKILRIGGMPDHIHILIGYNISDPIPEMVKDIKIQSTKWINENRYVLGHFNWQNGYGVFSYSRSMIDNVINYIAKQEEHHSSESFRTEYLKILDKANIEYDERFIFKPI